MKFTNGYWENREDHQIYSAVEVGDVQQPSDDLIKALCTIRHVGHRGDTLNKPTITVSLSSPCSDIISATATHFAGTKERGPRFELFPDAETRKDYKAKVTNNAGSLTLHAGHSNVSLSTEPSAFNIAYSGANTGFLTDVGHACLQYIVAPHDAHLPHSQRASTQIADPYFRADTSRSRRPYMSVSLGLQVGEYVYGLGERFGPLVKNGQEIDLWNEDAGTCTPYAYKNVPFYLTNRGYGVFINHTDYVSIEVQSERLARVQITVPGEQIRWMVIYGPSPKQILAKYAALTGRAPLPPAWSFGLYLSSSFLMDYSENSLTAEMDQMQDRKIPMSVFHFDCFWMKAHQWVSFEFDPVFFPDPRAFLDRLHQRGLKVCVWINPYIAQASPVFEEAVREDYLIKRPNGDVWQGDNWQAGMSIVDFTNPAAVQWYTANLQRLMDLGVDTFKTDFGERIPWEGVVYHNGMDPAAGHNYYSLLYNRTAYEAIVAKRGADEAALFARAATAGSQRYPVHWGGDCECTWNGMAQSLRGGLSLGLSGFGFWSHDIGGFMAEGQASKEPDAAIYKRWVQFGLLSSHSRLHGSRTSRAPWHVDEEACLVLKKFCELKNQLMPYLYEQAIAAHTQGLPLVRAMFIEFPNDRVCQSLDTQYMLGEALLVAPIFNESGSCEFYVPAGTWTGLLDGKERHGPGFFRETFDYFHLPLLLKENAVLPVGIASKPDYDWPTSVQTVVVGSCSVDEVTRSLPSFKHLGEFAGQVKVSGANGKEAKVECPGSPRFITLSPTEHL